jgi:hypothetical protein
MPNLPMKVVVSFDDDIIFCGHTSKPMIRISHKFKTNGSMSHTFKVELSEKVDSHTIIADNGKIINSAHISIKDIEICKICIDSILINDSKNLIKYTHNTNGHTDVLCVDFDGIMSFNGDIKFNFKNPLYKWLMTL